MSVNAISEETLALIAKATSNGVTSATGLVGYDLGSIVSLVPVNTPTFDSTPQEDGDGSLSAHWKSLLNINNAQPSPFVGLDGGGNFIEVSEIDILATYMPVRVSGQVTRDAVSLSRNYDDAKAVASVQTLMQWRIADNKALLGGQRWALPTIGATTLTTSTTGGTIAATTAVPVRVAARSGSNYYWGGSGAASAANTVTSGAGATNSVTATWAPVKGAVAYDVYVNGFYYTTVTAPAATVTNIPTANQAVPTNLPALYTVAPTAVPTVDTTVPKDSNGNPAGYNGYIASILGDYDGGVNGQVTPGTGTNSGATWTDLGGAALTGSSQGVNEIDNMNLAIYGQSQLSPTRITSNIRVAQEIGKASMGTNAAVTYLQTNESDRSGITVGVYAARYINRGTGESLEITVDPHMPDGMAMFLTDRIPYPNSGIANTFSRRTLQDVAETPYGSSLNAGVVGGGPRDTWDTSSLETLVNRAPVACGVLSGIG